MQVYIITLAQIPLTEHWFVVEFVKQLVARQIKNKFNESDDVW